jgi:tripartite-type tricarboxylate transporter receptor subunit TctC
VFSRFRWWVPVLGVVVSLSVIPETLAQGHYPSRPVRLVVPMPPGGAADILGRYVAEQLSLELGGTVVVDNKPGAGGNIGAEIVAKAAPDGYTLLLAPSSIYAVSASVYPSLGYRLTQDFSPVARLVNVPHVMLVNSNLPVRDVSEFIEYARSKPVGSVTLGSQGNGTVSHLEGELFARKAGLDFVHVPYKGSAPALLGLLRGDVDVFFDSLASARGQLQSGKIRALGITPARRISALPDVPAIGESGLQGFSAESYMGIFAPAGTPPVVIKRLNALLTKLTRTEVSRKKLIALGFEPEESSPEEYAKSIAEEVGKWAAVVHAVGLSID